MAVRSKRSRVPISNARWGWGVSLAFSLMIAMSAAQANPTGGTVVGGSAAINQTNPNQTVITQSTPLAVINWQSFSIGSNQSTIFRQPSAAATALNRVTGPDPSVIAGQLDANGNIILINPSGITFAHGAQVDVNSLVATPSDIKDSDFLAGRLVFDTPSPNANATVSNAGTISVGQLGLAALVAPTVSNSGVIAAKLGRVVLGGAENFTVDLYGDGLLSFDIGNKPPGNLGQSVTNTGQIDAAGGQVLLTAATADNIVSGVVNLGGTIDASSAGTRTDTVTADAGSGGALAVTGTVNVSGTAPGEIGGSATLTGKTVSIAPGAAVNASGAAGGGSIRVGGGARGNDPAVRNAVATSVATNAVLDASATMAGNGGSVVVWSEQQTSFNGAIAARGGPSGGNGGSAEVSSKNQLDFAGTTDLRALLGRPGTLLLDPADLDIISGSDQTISQSPSPCVAANACTISGTASPSDLSVTTLSTLLNLTGDVILSAGNIDVQAGLIYTGAASQLTMNATGTITLEANVLIHSITPLDLVIASGNTGVSLLSGASIFTGGGTLAITTPSLSLAAGASLSSGTAAMTLTAPSTEGMSVGAAVAGTLNIADATLGQITAGSLTLATAVGEDISAGGITSHPAAGTLTLQSGGAITLTDDINTTALALDASGSITQSSGVLTATTLTGQSSGGATLGDGNMVTNLGLFTDTGTGNVEFSNAKSLKVAGAVTAPGVVNLQVTSGSLTLDADVQGSAVTSLSGASGLSLSSDVTTAGITSLNAGTGAYTDHGHALDSGGNPLSLTATSLALTGSLDSGTAGTTITAASGEGMSVGTAVVGTLNVSDAVLGNITAGGLTLATATGENIAAGGITSHSGFTTLTLQSGGTIALGDDIAVSTLNLDAASSISQTNGAITATTLTGQSSGGASLSDENLVTDLGSFSDSSSGNVSITNNQSLTVMGAVSAPGSATLQVNTGSLTLESNVEGSGGTTLSAVDGIGLSGNVTTAGVTMLNAGSGAYTDNGFTLATGGGSLSVSATNLSVTGTLNSGAAAMTLTATGPGSAGTITEGSGKIVAGSLTGRSTGDAQITGLHNNVGTLAGFSSGTGGNGDFAFADTAALTVTSTVNANAGSASVSVTNGQSLTLDVNVLGTAGISLSAANGVSLGQALTPNGGTTINTGSGAYTDNGFSIDTSNHRLSITTADLLLTGSLDSGTAGTTITAASGEGMSVGTAVVGTLNVSDAVLGSITAGSLTLATATGENIAAGGITSHSGFTTLTLQSGGTIALGDDIAVSTLNLDAAGSISQTNGAITATTLTGQSSGGASLGDENLVTDLGSFTDSSSGNVSITNNQSLTVVGAVSAPGSATLQVNTGSLTLESNVEGSGGTTLSAVDGIGLSGNVTTAGVTMLNAGSGAYADNGFTLATGGGSLSVSATNLSVTGTLNSGAAAMTLTATGPGSAGTIAESSGKIITGSLTGSSTGDAQITGPSNAIGTLAGFNSGGILTVDNGQALTTTATVAASGDIVLQAPSLIINGTVEPNAGAGMLTLTATGPGSAGTINEANGSILAGTLTGSATGNAQITGSGNIIGTLNGFSGSGMLSVSDSQLLTTAGTIDGTTITLIAPSLTLGGTLDAGTVSLTANAPSNAGTIDETGGTIVAGSLTGSSTGEAEITGPGNMIGTLAGFSGSGALFLSSNQTITVSSVVATSGDISLSASAIVIDGTVKPGGVAGLLTLTASGSGSSGTIDEATGAIIAGSVTGSGTGEVQLTGPNNDIGTLAGFSSGSSLAVTDGATLTTTGTVSAATNIALQASALVVNGTITPNSGLGAVTLTATGPGSGGTIDESGGTILAGTMAGSSTCDALLTGSGNTFGTLGTFTSGAALTVADSQALAVSGTVDAASVALSAPSLTVTGTIDAASLILTANGAGNTGTIDASGGTVIVTSVTGTSTGDAQITGTNNAIGTLAGFSSGGVLTVADSETLTTTGTITAEGDIALSAPSLVLGGSIQPGNGSGTLTLTATGPSTAGTIAEGGGTIIAGALTGSSTGDAQITGPGNVIGTLAGFTASGALTFTDSQSLATSGTVDAASIVLTAPSLTINGTIDTAALTLTASGPSAAGTIDASGGTIIAGTLTGSGTGDVLLTGTGNNIATLDGFSAGGVLDVADGVSLTNAGLITAGGDIALSAPGLILGGTIEPNGGAGLVTLTATAGTIDESAGTILAGSLTGSSTGNAFITGPDNTIGTLLDFTGGESFDFQTSGSLVEGDVTVTARNIALVSQGDMTLHGGTYVTTGAQGGVVFSMHRANGIFSQTGVTTVTASILAIDVTGASLPLLQQITPINFVSLFNQAGGGPHGTLSGTILLQQLLAPHADLYIAANNGKITGGPITARGLGITGQGGSADLTGIINGVPGQEAAQLSNKNFPLNNLYRINDCATGTVGCIVLPQIIPVAPDLVTSVFIVQQPQQFTDPTLDLLNIGTEDLF